MHSMSDESPSRNTRELQNDPDKSSSAESSFDEAPLPFVGGDGICWSSLDSLPSNEISHQVAPLEPCSNSLLSEG